MSATKPFISIVMIAVCSAALIVAWHRRAEARASRAAVASLSSQRATLAAAIAVMERREGESVSASSPLAPTGHESRAPHAQQSDSARPATPAKSPQPAADTAAGLEASPGLRALFRRAFLSDLAIRHRGFYASAGLTPEQIARFEALMVEAEEVKLDFFATARAQGLEPSTPELAELRAEAAAEMTRSLHELLGEQGYQQLQRFKRALPLDVIVEDAAKLLASRAPLVASQRSRLLDTLANANPGYESGGAARLETIDWSRALAEAQTYLSPAQTAVLQQEADLQAVYAMVRQFYGQNVAAPEPASAGAGLR